MDKITAQMITNAHQALARAYAPYSGYRVASTIQTTNGNFYTGVNVENGSYGLTICAEASAICQMVSAGDQHIKNIVILAENNLLCPPCGACRQRIHEFADENTQIHLCNKDSIFHTLTLDQLLPTAFDFKHK